MDGRAVGGGGRGGGWGVGGSRGRAVLLIHRRGRVLAAFSLSPVSVASSIRCRPLSAVSSLALPLSVAPSAALGPRPSPHVVLACRSSRPAAGVAVLAASRHSLHAAAFVASRATRHCPWFSLHRLSCDHLYVRIFSVAAVHDTCDWVRCAIAAVVPCVQRCAFPLSRCLRRAVHRVWCALRAADRPALLPCVARFFPRALSWC